MMQNQLENFSFKLAKAFTFKNMKLTVVGWILTVLDFFVSSLGSIGSLGIIDLTDIISSVNKILASFLCMGINLVLPLISIKYLNLIFKSAKKNLQNKQRILQILRYVFVYPIVLCLDFYTTFLGVGQLFILDELSHLRVENLEINLETICRYSSVEKLGYSIGVSIILLIGHFILAGTPELTENVTDQGEVEEGF